MDVPEISEEKIEEHFGNSIIGRGKDYWEEGRVKAMALDGRNLTAKVQGSAFRPYVVEVDLEELKAECTCPYHLDCKHAVAALYTLKNNPEKAIDAGKAKESVQELDKEELTEKIVKAIEKDKFAALRLLELKEGVESVKDRLEEFNRKISSRWDFQMHQIEIAKLEKWVENNVLSEEADERMEKLVELLEDLPEYAAGVDDSNGRLGDLIYRCTEEAVRTAEDIGGEEAQKAVEKLRETAERDEVGHFIDLGWMLRESGFEEE